MAKTLLIYVVLCGILIELQAFNSEILAMNIEIQTMDSEMQTMNSEIQTTDSEMQTMNSEIQTMNSEIQTMNSEIQIMDSEIHKNLSDSSPSVGQPCNNVNETVADTNSCEVYLICSIAKEWSNRSCSFPFLFSDTEKLCQDFNNVTCGGRREPRSPCMYTGDFEAKCTYIPQRTICQCINTTDLNFDMCVNQSDGLYAWPSRKLSRYYIQCLKGRTLPMMCEGSSMLFDFQEKQCLLVYDEVSRLYNHTALQPESTFASVPPPNVYVTLTRFTHDRYVSLQQSTSGFDSDFFTSGGNSVGKQTFVPAFSQLIYASLIDGHVTQTNLVYERSVLFQQTSSVCVTNALYSNSETSVPVFYSYVALNVHMTQTQFVPEKYSLLQPVDGTVIFKPSTLSFAALKSTSEIYPIQLEPFASYIKINCTAVPDSTMETLIPVSNTLISLSSFFITASLSATTRIQNSYPSDPVQTLPNRMTKVLTSTTTITNLLERSSGKHHWLDKAVNTPLSDQIINYKSSDFLEMSVINYKTYLSVGCISTSEIISPSKYKRDSDVIENLTIQHLSTSYALSVKIDASSLDQHGYVPLNPSPTLDSSKTPFSTINSMAQLMLTIVASIQPTKANIASKSAPHTASMKSSEKPNVDANETTNMASSEANIFPSNMALSRSPSISPMSTTEDQMRSELILDSSFISSTSMKFSALLHKSETSVMGTYSLMRLFQSQHSTSFEYSPLQTTIFEVGGPSSRTALKIVPRPTPVTYDSQLSPSNILEISPSQSITCLATSIISNSSSSVKFSQTNVSSLISLTDSIPSSAPYMSNSQSAESTKSNRNDNITKTIISTKDQKLNPLNLSNTSFIAVLVGSCAGVLFIIMLTTILIIHLRKRTKRKRYLQSG